MRKSEEVRQCREKLKQNPQLEEEYRSIVKEQLEAGIVEREPEKPTGERLFCMPHKSMMREQATTTKVRMVFHSHAKAHPLMASVNSLVTVDLVIFLQWLG